HAIIALLMARAQNGVEIIYTPGNHDAFFRQYIGAALGNVAVADHVIHTGVDGRRFLVIHGDSVDIFSGRFPVLSRLAARAENIFRGLGNGAQRLLHRFELPIVSQVDRIVARINDVIRKQDNFQERLADLARKHGADGIICGHFHQPALHDDYGVTYANCGDWVENTSALVETHDGRLVSLDWGVARAPVKPRRARELVQGV
ncbi:MAG: metallophosphoesterase, partial [Deltaproteobacteria bacterium]